MSLEELREKLEDYDGLLPGWDAQLELSPPYREKYDLEQIKKTNPKVAAVLIMLYENDEALIEFPITLRQTYEGVHSGQFSLPGGSFEPRDIDLSNTAARETCEELGVRDDCIDIVTQLTELYIPPSNFLVYPFVGVYSGLPEFFPQEEEVAEIIPLDLSAFLHAQPENFDMKFGQYTVEIPGYNLGEGECIWGATAMILSEFASLIKKL